VGWIEARLNRRLRPEKAGRKPASHEAKDEQKNLLFSDWRKLLSVTNLYAPFKEPPHNPINERGLVT
jgi:hypothetical protein